MISRSSRPRLRPRAPRLARAAAAADAAPAGLRWIHDGHRYRVTVWPDVEFAREAAPGKWRVAEIGEDVFASAALGVTGNQWRRYLEFVPAAEREFLEGFEFGRMAALYVMLRCPALVTELVRLPALVPFLAAHLSLRGGSVPGWAEINAVFERDGIFGVLQWLGLPATRQTLAVLQNISDPDVPRRLLQPLRAALWEPEASWTLAHAPGLNDEQLAEACHALAA